MDTAELFRRRILFPCKHNFKRAGQRLISRSIALPLKCMPESWSSALMGDAVRMLYDSMVEVGGLTPQMLITGYCHGIFPMVDQNNKIKWFDPDPRGVLPLELFHLPRSLRRTVRKQPFDITFNKDFPAVMSACADRETTWISPELINAYVKLHELGYAHSVEAWQQGKLVGGLYGVSIGGVFAGESMFYRVKDAGHVAYVHFIERLKQKGFLLQDCQYPSRHMAQFGAIAISRQEYKDRLMRALAAPASFV